MVPINCYAGMRYDCVSCRCQLCGAGEVSCSLAAGPWETPDAGGATPFSIKFRGRFCFLVPGASVCAGLGSAVSETRFARSSAVGAVETGVEDGALFVLGANIVGAATSVPVHRYRIAGAGIGHSVVAAY